MTGNVDVNEMDRRARTAGYGDGLLEIFAAIVLLTIALVWLTQPVFVGILAAFIVLYGWKVVERVKERVTYPRIGYFRERSDDPASTSRGMLVFIGGAMLLMVFAVYLSGGFNEPSEWRRAAPLLSGVSLAGGFWYAGDRSGLLRYRLIAGLSAIGGVMLWLLGSGDSYLPVAWHLVGLALPLLVLGIWSLVRFLRAHPILEPPTDG
jgi:hypothetical protein